MKYIGTSYLKKKRLLEILIVFVILSFFIGFILYQKIDHSQLLVELQSFKNYLDTEHINFILYHLIVMSFGLFLSLSVIGILFFPCYFLFEMISITYSIFSFTSVYHIKGFFYSLIYNFLCKFCFLFFWCILFLSIIKILKYFYLMKRNQTIDYRLAIQKNMKRIYICLLSIFIYDCFLYFFGATILRILCFL